MFQARHKQLMHETNVAVVNIRNTELTYFMVFFQNLGVNAAVGFGLIAGSVSQVPGYENPTGCWYGFVVLYWVASALTVVSSIFALITEIFVVVYGHGLALRGPVGSMVKAIDGMVEEQKTIFSAFAMTICFLGLQQIGMYFIMMDSTSAWISGGITLVAMISWYRYALRLYNRFHWKQIEIAWKEEEDREKNNAKAAIKRGPVDDDDDIDPITRLEQVVKAQQLQKQQQSSGNNKSTAGKRTGVFSILNKKKKTKASSKKSVKGSVVDDSGSVLDEYDDDDDDNVSKYYEQSQLKTIEEDEEDESDSKKDGADNDPPSTGFLSIRIPKKRSIFGALSTLKTDSDGSSGDWKRRFFLIQGTSVYYYADKRSYDSDPNKPLNPRPIELDGYTLIGGAQVAPYYISLIPADPEDDRKAWKFRCDTIHEFHHWIECFTKALRQCASWRQSDATEFIDIAAMRADPHETPQSLLEESDED